MRLTRKQLKNLVREALEPTNPSGSEINYAHRRTGTPLYYRSPARGTYREVLDPENESDHKYFKKYGLHTPEKIKHHSDGAYELHGMANSTSAKRKGYVWRYLGPDDNPRSPNPQGFYWVNPAYIVDVRETLQSEDEMRHMLDKRYGK